MGCGDSEGGAWLSKIWDEHAKEGMWQFHNSLEAPIFAMCNSLTSSLCYSYLIPFSDAVITSNMKILDHVKEGSI